MMRCWRLIVIAKKGCHRIATRGLVSTGSNHQEIQTLHKGLPVNGKIVRNIVVIVFFVVCRIHQFIVAKKGSWEFHTGLELFVARLRVNGQPALGAKDRHRMQFV